jgi:hypothetical protein
VSRIEVSTVIARTPADVWADVRDIASHVTWMADAAGIRFVTARREGVGTRFECDTKVGPFRLTDAMEITAWDEGRSMGVRHTGLVRGRGELSLEPVDGDRTRFRWTEELSFPWWLGGRAGEIAGRPVLASIWRGNLRRLRRRLEGGDRSQ